MSYLQSPNLFVIWLKNVVPKEPMLFGCAIILDSMTKKYSTLFILSQI